MSIGFSTIWAIDSAATTSNVNGGGFNPDTTQTSIASDLATSNGTSATPDVSSATYTFVAHDVNAWLYILNGTNWYHGWYKITAVNAGVATLAAAVGQGVVRVAAGGIGILSGSANLGQRLAPSTNQGCASAASASAANVLVDYSQYTAAVINGLTDLTCTAGSTTVGSASAQFTASMVGNLLHATALTGTGAIVGWYEIVQYLTTSTVVLDRTPTNGVNNITAGTFYVGGAMSLNSTLDDDLFEAATAANNSPGNQFFIKSGSYTLGETVSIAIDGGTQAPIKVIGFTSVRGDSCLETNRPVINSGANQFSSGDNWDWYNLNITGTAATLFSSGLNCKSVNCKFLNTSVTTTRVGYGNGAAGGDNFIWSCDCISYRGRALTVAAASRVINSWIHDSDQGVRWTAGVFELDNSILFSNITAALVNTFNATTTTRVSRNTIYGAENKLGIGFDLATGCTDVWVDNNIFAGLAKGVNAADVQSVSYDDYNCYYNNTTDVTNWNKGAGDIATNPTFTSVGQLTGTGATSATNVLTYATGGFNAILSGLDDIACVYLVSGTGTGFTAGVYPIHVHTDTTLTLATPLNTALNITSSGSGTSIVFQITYGLNFAVGTNMKAKGFPGAFVGGLTTGYLDIGATQRQEASSGGGPLIGGGLITS